MTRASLLGRSKNRDRSMDCRIKSGNDDFPTPLGYFPASW
jgi:hypothetical protein